MAAEALHPSSNGVCNYLDTLSEPEGPAALPGSDWEDQLIQQGFNPADLRATREANDSDAVSWVNDDDNPYGGLVGDTVWHMAARQSDERFCRFLRSRGLVDMINNRDSDGATPLMYAVSGYDEPGYLCEVSWVQGEEEVMRSTAGRCCHCCTTITTASVTTA